ncbi:hypothetical protein Trydic_g6927 [Trypoxylus dichotomus]
MEEKTKRNVEDIVNKLRQPAVITDRKTVKNKTFESLPVSAFHQKESDYKPTSNSLKTCSLLSLVDKCDIDEKGGKIIYKNYNFDEVKDCCTQTSKTIIQLAKIETGEMSPDSLSPTPRNCKPDYCNSNFENFTLDTSIADCNSYRFSRKNNIVQYFQSLDELHENDSKSVPPKASPVVEYPRKSLIETYLEKSRQRINHNVSKSRESTSREITKYVQPSNPINAIIDEDPISISATKERKTLVERSSTPPKISPIMPAADFRRDMMRIDQMSLTLLPSDDSLSARTRRTDGMSIFSSEISLGDLLSRIQDVDWNVSLRGLAEVTELCRTADAELMMPYMITINQKLIELLRSPRSHVCRTACQAAGHLFESMKDTRGPEFNDIVDILLGKTADANKFIRQDANLALDCMVTHIPTFHAIRALCSKGPLHKNHLVRSATVRLIICAVVIAGPDLILNPVSNEHTRKRIFNNMMRFLEDKNLETRKYGERLYKVLSKERSWKRKNAHRSFNSIPSPIMSPSR